MARRQSEILGLFTSPQDIQRSIADQFAAQATQRYSDPITQQLYRGAGQLTGAVARQQGMRLPGEAEAQQIKDIRESVPFDAENQSQYYTTLAKRLIDQGLTQAGYQALELARQARTDEARAMKDERTADSTGPAGRYTAGDKEAIREASAEARSSRGRSLQAKRLRDRFLQEQPMSGIIGSLMGSFKSFVGGQTAIDNLKKEYDGLRISDGMANLPPGAASDKDVELALSRFPTSNDNPTYIARFLNGLYKASAVDAEYNNFYAQYLSDNFGNSAGVEDAWSEVSSTIDWEGKYGFTWNEDIEAPEEDSEQLPDLGIGDTVTIDGITIERVE